MNPAGIVFGPDATLNVEGSVAFTTADYLRLAEVNGSNSGIFHADTTATSLLTSAPVRAFGFLGSNPASLAILGSTLDLRHPNESISLVGGNKGFSSANVIVPNGVTITNGYLSTTSGNIGIASVASQGEILSRTLDQTQNINRQPFQELGTIQLSQSGLTTSSDGNGSILIRGGHLIIDTAEVSTTTGDISVSGTSIGITNTNIATKTTATENAGHIVLETSGDIALESGVLESFSGNASRHAGNISISSSQGRVDLKGGSFVTSQADSGGHTGHIKIDAQHGNILLENAFVFTFAQGAGKLGGIQIKANTLTLQKEASILGNNFATQVADDIVINLKGRLKVTEASVIETGTPGSHNAAALIIESPDILIDKDSRLATSTTSSGHAGQLTLFTDNLRLTDGGKLSSRSIWFPESEIPLGSGGEIRIRGFRNPRTSVVIDGPGSGILTDTQGNGPAGNIEVTANSVTLQNSGRMSATTSGIAPSAKGGSIIINATDQVMMTNEASITASSTGPADAGNISINAGRQLDVLNGSITTQAAKASGGNIDIKAIDLIRVVNGTISSSVQGGPSTTGGNITIDPKTVVLQDAQILASARQGNGGNITITTPLFLNSNSKVDASSQFGLNGSVTIQSPTSNLSGTVGQLASKTSPPQVLLQNRCVALAGGEQSTFILAGRDTLPNEPGGWLSSPVAMEHWTGEEKEHASGLLVQRNSSNGVPVMAALRNDSPVLSLRRLTPPGFLVRAFAAGTTGCPS